jgi:hypothetical protein
VNQRIFRYVPKNRIVANTFKVRKNDSYGNLGSQSSIGNNNVSINHNNNSNYNTANKNYNSNNN